MDDIKQQQQIKLNNHWGVWFSYICIDYHVGSDIYNFAATLSALLIQNGDLQELIPERVKCSHGIAAIYISDALDTAIKNGFTDNIIKLSALLSQYKNL